MARILALDAGTTGVRAVIFAASLTGGAHLCDCAYASATGCYPNARETWDAGLLDAVARGAWPRRVSLASHAED